MGLDPSRIPTETGRENLLQSTGRGDAVGWRGKGKGPTKGAHQVCTVVQHLVFSPVSSVILVVCQPALGITGGCSLMSLGLSEEGAAERFAVPSALLRF